MTLEHVVRVRGARGEGQDRIATLPCAGGLRIVLADGAGGTARGGEAAQRVVDRLSAGVDVDTLDDELAALGGQSTVVAIEIAGDSIDRATRRRSTG